MKVPRSVLWAAAMAATFLYLTSGTSWDIGRWIRPFAPGGHLWSEPASAATTFTPDEQNNIDIYKTGREATVNITSVVYRQTFFFQVYPEKGTGSGFIIKPTGEILTNNHVVNGARELTVTLANKKVYKARVVAKDESVDLALIKIDATEKLPVLPLGNSDALVVGQKVLAIGNPFGFDGTLTTGIVSSLNRSIQTDETHNLEGMIQTDAAINPGNSGGPLFDSHGNVIGINTAIYGSQGSVGVGFATPISKAKAMLSEIEQTGHISKPTLGVSVQFVSEDLAQMLGLPASGGLLIQDIERGSAAEAAGLHGPTRDVIVGGFRELGIGGDLIVAVDGEPVTSAQTLQRALDHKRGGDTMSLTIYRNGATRKVDVKLGEAPQEL
ncbi:MAG TPA: trypsin-like peptidase domain-containing protein [Bryobacteraceae bacterium]|nr:trypsin-like peptidase domain-containing protein [Bryobacteraceae bacterium]